MWTCILALLTEEGWIAETGQIDSSYVKAHRCSGGAKGGTRSRASALRCSDWFAGRTGLLNGENYARTVLAR